jgi:hypothetical protein
VYLGSTARHFTKIDVVPLIGEDCRRPAHAQLRQVRQCDDDRVSNADLEVLETVALGERSAGQDSQRDGPLHGVVTAPDDQERRQTGGDSDNDADQRDGDETAARAARSAVCVFGFTGRNRLQRAADFAGSLISVLRLLGEAAADDRTKSGGSVGRECARRIAQNCRQHLRNRAARKWQRAGNHLVQQHAQ